MTGFVIDEDGNVRAADRNDPHQRLTDANAILLRQLRAEQEMRKRLEAEIQTFLEHGDRQRLARAIDRDDGPNEPPNEPPAADPSVG